MVGANPTYMHPLPLDIPTPPLDIPPIPSPDTHPLLVTSDGHDWRPVQICSLLDIPPIPPPDTHPLLVTSGGHDRIIDCPPGNPESATVQ